MGQPAKVHEPSMEEILASIRRIIADDDTAKAPPPKPASPPPRPTAAPPPPPLMEPSTPPPEPAAAASESEDVPDLTESMAAPEPQEEPPNFQTIDGQPDVIFSDVPPQSEPPPRPPEESPLDTMAYRGSDRSLLSPSTSAAVDSAFNALAQTVLVHNARTLEDLVREMLRPLLKSWLDDNLPSLVERIVKAEIDRVAHGR
jgi:uncharacterized protein